MLKVPDIKSSSSLKQCHQQLKKLTKSIKEVKDNVIAHTLSLLILNWMIYFYFSRLYLLELWYEKSENIEKSLSRRE